MNSQKKSLQFRNVNKDDVEELSRLLNDLTEEAKYFFHPHPFDKKTLTDICSTDKDHYFVMTLNSKIVGYSMLRLFGYEIPSFGCCIRTGHEGKGYGFLITKLTIEKAKELGYEKVILKVYKNNIKAYNLYKKIGFQTDKKLRETDEIKMYINLA